MKKLYIVLLGILTVVAVWQFSNNGITENEAIDIPSQKKMSLRAKQDKPGELLKYFQEITTKWGEEKPGYGPNYRHKEFQKALNLKKKTKTQRTATITEVISRGPGNVGGRTRALIVDPDDATSNTWFAGSASGGIWKTTDAGQTWTNLKKINTTCPTSAKAIRANAFKNLKTLCKSFRSVVQESLPSSSRMW